MRLHICFSNAIFYLNSLCNNRNHQIFKIAMLPTNQHSFHLLTAIDYEQFAQQNCVGKGSIYT